MCELLVDRRFVVQAGALVGVAALGGIAVAAVRGTQELYELGAQFDDVSDNIRVKTGAMGGDLDALTQSVENIAKSTPASIAVIGDVVAETRRNLHLTGGDLENVSKTITNLNRMTGDQANMRELGKAFRAFGVDAADQEGVLDQLYTATTNTGLSVNDLIASLVNGGAELRALGLDVGDAAALVATFEAEGLDADKMIKGLGKSFVKFADEGKTPIQGLTETLGLIRNLIDTGRDAEARDLAAEIFGTKSGASFFEAVKNGKLDIQNLNDALAATPISINAMAASTDDGAESWTIFRNNLELALEPLASTVFDRASTGLESLTVRVQENSDQIIDAAVSIGVGFIDALDAIAGFASGGLKVMRPFAVAGSIYMSELIGRTSEFVGFVGEFLEMVPGMSDVGEGLTDLSESGLKTAEAMRALPDMLDTTVAGIDDFRGVLPGWRSAVQDVGDEMKVAAGKGDELTASLGGVGGAAGASLGDVTRLKTELSNMPEPKTIVSAPKGVPGSETGSPSLADLRPGGGGRGAGLNLQIAAAGGSGGGAPRKVGSDLNLKPGTIAVKDEIATAFPDITDIGGWRANDPYPDHPSGRAIDVMIPNWNTPAGQQMGDQVAAMALQNPNVNYVLWRQTQWNSDGTSTPMEDRGSPTQNHMDHVHVYTYENTGQHPQGSPVSKSGGSIPGTLPMSNAPGSTNPNQVNAFGPGFEPGLGTPGYDEYGEPGYYEPDPKDIRESQQRVEDAEQRVIEADDAVRQAKARAAELEADATEDERLAAESSVQKAEYDAKVARREAEDARAEANEAKKGKFTPAKEGQKGKGGATGGPGLGELGNIASSFLTETFGFGSWLPDLGNLMPVQAADTILSSLVPALAQSATGGDVGTVPGGTTSGLPFGIPDVVPPPMQTGQPAIGVGGTTVINNNDLSNNYQGNVGLDPETIRKQNERGQARALARLGAIPQRN